MQSEGHCLCAWIAVEHARTLAKGGSAFRHCFELGHDLLLGVALITIKNNKTNVSFVLLYFSKLQECSSQSLAYLT